MNDPRPITGTAHATYVDPVRAPAATPVVKQARIEEHNKTPEQRAEDFAYTLNHALSCITTDIIIVPTIAAGFKPSHVSYVNEALGYMRGEVVGDLAAVPITVMIQRFFPGFMDMVGRMVDPIAKPMFKHGARTAAERWGKKQGLEATNGEVIDHAQAIYEHEMQHLPQAVMWNVISYPLSVVGQSLMGAEGGWKHIARNKLLGTVISNFLLIGGRAMEPDRAEKFDRWNSKHVIRPTSRALSGLFGIDSKTIDRIEKKADAAEAGTTGSWRNRVQEQDTNIALLAQPSV